VFSIVLSTITADYYFVSPTHSLKVPSSVDQVTLLIFVVVGFSMALLAHSQRRAVGRTEEQRQQLETTLASIGDAVIAADAEGQVTFINHVAESLTGWKREDALRQPLESVFQIVNEDTRQPVENPALRAMQEGHIVGLANHTVLITRTGSDIPIDDSGSPVIGPTGKPSGAVLIFRDITERRRADGMQAELFERERLARQSEHEAREAAEAAELRLKLALDAGHMGTWEYGVRTGAVIWSPGLEQIHGYKPGVFPGTFEAFRNEIHPDDRDRVVHAIGEAIEQRRDHHIEYRIVRKDGSVRWVEGRGRLFLDHDESPDRMVGVCADITDRKQAEERFRLAVEAAPAAMLMVDSAGTIVLANALAEQMLGYGRNEIVGLPIERLVPARFREQHVEYRTNYVGAARQRPMGAGRDLYAVRKDGSEVPVEIGLSPIQTADGNFVISAVTDITERKRAQERLLRNQQTFVELVERAPFGLYIVDSHFRIAHMNAGSQSGTFRNVRPVIGRDFEQAMRILWPEPVATEIIRVFRHTLETGEPYYSPRFTNPRHDVAAVESYEWELHRITLPDGQFGVICYYFDSTKIRESEQREQRLRQLAEEANRVKDEFLAMLSHELRNPLSSILGWAVVLRTGQMPLERAGHALEVIERNARLEAQLVESLLDLSRMTAGKLKLDSERVDLPAVLQSVVDSARPAADSKAITIEIGAAPGVVLVGDTGRLQQVFANLVGNAVKFTPRGGHIQVRLKRVGSHAQVQIIDDGEGIEADFIPHIFDRFRQAETTKGRTHGGLGLGLAIVRELVQAHGGTVVAQSPGKGRGSTFTVTIPIPAVIPADLDAASPSLVPAEEPSISRLRILVVDDDADARELVGLTLQSRGAVVQLTSSASEALRSISRQRPDVLIADIGMPGEDGYVLIQTLRAIERENSLKRLPAIALTAYATTADRDQALAAGYDLHLAKPVGPKDLTQAVSKFRTTREREA
jgi:hypothetical protein